MDDIAREAGLGRKTLYRHFDDRTALMDAVLLHLILGTIEDTRRHIASCETLGEAIVQSTLYGLRYFAKDALYMDIVQNSSESSIEAMMLNSNPAVKESITNMWRPLFKKAREIGELRSPLADEWLAEYVRTIGGVLILRSDLSPIEQRRFITDFLLKTILG